MIWKKLDLWKSQNLIHNKPVISRSIQWSPAFNLTFSEFWMKYFTIVFHKSLSDKDTVPE